MYTTVRDQTAGPWFRLLFTTGGTARVSRNVILLGLTSLFTDISSEMLAAVLPLYFMLELRMTPLQFGLIDGLYQGTSAIVRVGAGMIADAGTRYKAVASIGYGLSAVCKIGLIAVGSTWGSVTALLLTDRLGKGIRTAPRDALISLSSDPARLGEAFGVHRALDTIGAVVGPLMAFGILTLAPSAYRTVFTISFLMAVIGLAVIVLLVENCRAEPTATPPAQVSFLDLLKPHHGGRVIMAGGMLGALTATDALIFLLVQRKGGIPPTLFPLLFVGMAVAYFLLALPLGRLADRIGRHRLFVAGHAAVIAIYLLLLSPWFPPALGIVVVALLGAYYAATDGVLSALATTRFAAANSTGLSLVATVAALARLVAAVAFGAIWTWWQASGALSASLSAWRWRLPPPPGCCVSIDLGTLAQRWGTVTPRARLGLFAAVVVAALAATAVSLALAVRGTSVASAPGPLAGAFVPPATGQPFLLFRSLTQDAGYSGVAYVNPDGSGDRRLVPGLECRRVHMAGGRGVCLAIRGGTAFTARIFDRTFAVRAELPLAGVPSRVQVSPDGSLAATTVFVSGHSYADTSFSTRTSIVDLTSGRFLVEDLETLGVRRDGRPFDAVDFNFWGITFLRDSRTFYATLATAGRTYLVRGHADQPTLEVIDRDVECPSISPNNRLLAFKQRTDGGAGPVQWEIWLLDLETRQRWALGERHSVDDQVQWLDDQRIVYARPTEGASASTDLWVVERSGSAPRSFLGRAGSPVVVGSSPRAAADQLIP